MRRDEPPAARLEAQVGGTRLQARVELRKISCEPGVATAVGLGHEVAIGRAPIQMPGDVSDDRPLIWRKIVLQQHPGRRVVAQRPHYGADIVELKCAPRLGAQVTVKGMGVA